MTKRIAVLVTFDVEEEALTEPRRLDRLTARMEQAVYETFMEGEDRGEEAHLCARVLPGARRATHLKKGTEYTVLAHFGLLQVSEGDHLKDGSSIAIYMPEDGDPLVFARGVSSFMDGRFDIGE